MDPPKNEPSEWFKFFPNLSKDSNYSSSLSYLKQLTTIAFSCIAYEVLPRNCFTEEIFEGMKLRILKTMCSNNAAQFLNAALVDAYDALDKGYLHKLALCFYEGECKLGKLTESHVFEYFYTDERVTLNVLKENQLTSRNTNYTFENVRRQTLDLLRDNLALMGSRQNILPSAYGLSIRLYYNEAAPADYHAPGFISEEGKDHLEHISLKEHQVGRVRTEFNQLSLLSYVKFGASQEAIPTQKPPELSHRIEELAPKVAVDEAQIMCPCKVHEQNDNSTDEEMLTCYYCNKRQHAACFGVFWGAAAARARHCCAACRDADAARAATDMTLAPLSQRHRASLCIFRRALKFCSQRASVEARALAARLRVSRASAARLMAILQQHGVLAEHPHNNSYETQNIREEYLNLAMKKFSNKKEDKDNVVDRLFSEIEDALTQDSYQSNNNPIEEVLTPLEKDDLRNTSNMGSVKEKPVEISVAEDPTLNQYKQALFKENIEDPLPIACDWRKKYVKRMPTRADDGNNNKKRRLQLIKKKF